MNVTDFISSLPGERQAVLIAMHEVIVVKDPNVIPVIKPMMGKEMILYEQRSYMKYGLASTKNYMSLHCLPMYMNAPLHQRLEKLLPDAKFQKGCINFTDAEAFPLDILGTLIAGCAAIDLAAMLENRKKKK